MMRIVSLVVFLSSSLALSACGTGDTSEQAARGTGELLHHEDQLADVSAMLKEAMNTGEVIANPITESGIDPYVFVSESARTSFYQLLDEAGLTVSVHFATLDEISQSDAQTNGDVAPADLQTKSYCGPGHDCSSAGFCRGGIVDCSYGYCNLPGYYGAYTEVDTSFPGSMVPFSAEVSLPHTASALGDYNFDYNAPRALYIDRISSSSSARRSKHRCCYWFWGSPSWTIQCSQNFYNQL